MGKGFVWKIKEAIFPICKVNWEVSEIILSGVAYPRIFLLGGEV